MGPNSVIRRCRLNARFGALQGGHVPRSESAHKRTFRGSPGARIRPQIHPLPAPKIFLRKRRSHKGYPFYGQNHFGQVFVRGGMTKISKWKSPHRGSCSPSSTAIRRCVKGCWSASTATSNTLAGPSNQIARIFSALAGSLPVRAFPVFSARWSLAWRCRRRRRWLRRFRSCGSSVSPRRPQHRTCDLDGFVCFRHSASMRAPARRCTKAGGLRLAHVSGTDFTDGGGGRRLKRPQRDPPQTPCFSRPGAFFGPVAFNVTPWVRRGSALPVPSRARLG